jgi:hypothetical protein
MQAHGAARGGVGTTMPRRGGRLEVLVAIAAIVVIAAVVALMVWVVPLATSGVGAEDAISKGQGAVKNTGIMHASMVKDMGQMRGTDPGKVAPLNAGAGSAMVHDDAGNMPATGAGAAVIHDAGNVR